MQVDELVSAETFLERVGGLTSDEARNSLVLGIAHSLAADPSARPDARFFVVTAADTVTGAALMTPPANLVLADSMDPQAAVALAQTLAGRDLPGVVGSRPGVDLFVDAWEAANGGSADLAMAQGVFAVEDVNDVPQPAGAARIATREDVDLIVDRLAAFSAEALPGESFDRDRMRAVVRRRTSDDSPAGFWLWEREGDVVASSHHSGPTGSGIRISGVYTPPEYRGRGYATALVAAESRWLLDNGFRFCFLFTDLANPTSNAIYRRIGYRQVAESAMYRFSPLQTSDGQLQGAVG